jgi:GT2 family glycosyltransferase
MAEITVVVPARDASATIGRTLAALAGQEVDVDYEVVVVDSGSTDDTPKIVSSSGVVTAVLHNPGGEPASSRNMGARHGTGRVLAFTDADCEPVPSWLASGLRALEQADIVQGKVLPVSEPGPFDRTVRVLWELGLYETANLFVRRELFVRIGGFEPVIALSTGELVQGVAASRPKIARRGDARPFGEDVWFGWRAKRSGARSAFAEDALVYHAVFPRGLRDFVAEHARARYFPPLVALVPELRDPFLKHRIFLSPASARFDLALAGLLAAGLTRRRLLALTALLPYAALLTSEARRWPPRERARITAGLLAADAVTFVGLVRGSIGARTVVL